MSGCSPLANNAAFVGKVFPNQNHRHGVKLAITEESFANRLYAHTARSGPVMREGLQVAVDDKGQAAVVYLRVLFKPSVVLILAAANQLRQLVICQVAVFCEPFDYGILNLPQGRQDLVGILHVAAFVLCKEGDCRVRHALCS